MTSDDLVDQVAAYVSRRLLAMVRRLAEDHQPDIRVQASAPNNYAGIDLTLNWTNRWRNDADLFSVTSTGPIGYDTSRMEPHDITHLIRYFADDHHHLPYVMLDLIEVAHLLAAKADALAELNRSGPAGAKERRTPLPANPNDLIATYLMMGGLAQ